MKKWIRFDYKGDKSLLGTLEGDFVDEFEGLVQDPDGEVAQVSRICVTRRG